MNLAGFTLENKVIVAAMVTILSLWGLLSFMTMPRREDPEYTVRTAVVSTSWPGTPVERMEELVSSKLEDEIDTMDGIRWVRSLTQVGLSTVYVELDRQTPAGHVDQMWDKVRARIDRVRMPARGVEPVLIDDFGNTNVMLMALFQAPLAGESTIRPENVYSPRDLDVISRRLADELKLVEGVAKIEMVGVQNEVIYLEQDLGTFSQIEVTPDKVAALVAARNTVTSGGQLDTPHGRFSISPSGDLDVERELRSIVVGGTGKEERIPVYLQDLGYRIDRTYQDPPLKLARWGDAEKERDCVLVAFSIKSGANIVDVCERAKALLDRLLTTAKILPPDVRVELVSDQSENVTAKIRDFAANVAGAVAIVIAVVFLMVGLRSAAVMAANIPIVMLGTLALVTLFGVQLEQISIAALIIALGMLVDNAVQICDQSMRLQSEGLSRREAAIQGAKQLAFPMLIATCTTVAAFLPILAGLKGTAREFVYSLPVTISVTLLLSWLLAMTFCTLLAYMFIRPPADPTLSASPPVRLIQMIRRRGGPPPAEKGESFLARSYLALSSMTLKVRWPIVAISAVLLVVTLRLPLSSEFFPPDIRDQFAVEVWLPESASIEQTSEVARDVEEIIRRLSPHTGKDGSEVERLRSMCTVVGGGAPRWYLGRSPEPAKPNYAEIVIRTSDGWLTYDYVQDIRRAAEEGDERLGLEPVPEARVIPRQLVLGPAVDAPIGFRIFGPKMGTGFADWKLMREHADALKDVLRATDGVWDVHDTWGAPTQQLYVDIDPDRANLSGVTNEDVAQTLSMYFSGDYVTTFREQDHLVPVYLRLPPEQRVSLDQIDSAFVSGVNGMVPLDAVATTETRWTPAQIERRFRQRVIEVRGRTEPGYRELDLVAKLVETPEFKAWAERLPPGYTWEIGGALYESNINMQDMKTSLVITLLSIVLLLIIQYNGVAKPLIIITTLPLALIGAYGGVYLTGNALGFMAQLGLLSLFGIVVNTAIIFLEFADGLILERARGSDGSGPICGLTSSEFRDCLARAGQVRLMPIAMTTLTTIGGLLPLALWGGPLWEAMSWLMIYGLIVATVLTLVVVPAIYTIMVETFKVKPVILEQ